MNEEIKSFFTETVWPFWVGVRFHEKKPGPKIPALDIFLKRATTIGEAERIFAALQAQVRFVADQDRNRQKWDRMPHLRTWIYQYRYDDEIGSHAEIREKANQQKRECNCGATDAFAFSGGYICNACYLKTTDLTDLREAYKRHGLQRKKDETPEAHRARMMQIARQLGYRGGKVA